MELSTGALAAIEADPDVLSRNQRDITLQIVEKREVSNNERAGSRVRLSVSDGSSKMTAFLSAQLAGTLDPATLNTGAIIRVSQCVGNRMGQKVLLIIMACEVVGWSKPTEPQNPSAQNNSGPSQDPGFQQNPNIHQNPSAYQNPNPNFQQNPNFHNSGPPQPPQNPNFQNPNPTPQQNPSSFQQRQQTLPPPPNPYRPVNQPPMNQPPSMTGQRGPMGMNGPGPNPYGQSSFNQRPGNYGGNSYGANTSVLGESRPQTNMNVPPAYRSNAGPVARNEAPPNIMPIHALNPYINKWTIMGRCSGRQDVKRWSNARGEGKVFSFEVVDKDGGEIRLTAFNEQADELDTVIEMGGVYIISKGTMKPKNARFNNTSHQYEIMLERKSEVERVPEDAQTASIPKALYKFKKIQELQEMEKGAIVDVLGVIDSAEPWQTIMLKSGDETSKRQLVIRDDSGCSIEFTLWGNNHACTIGEIIEQDLQRGNHPLVAVKSARVGDFNGRNLSTISSSHLQLNPDIPEATALQNWYCEGGSGLAIEALSSAGPGSGKATKRTCVANLKNEGAGGQPAFVMVPAAISYMKDDNMYYPGCPGLSNGRTCNKKLRLENENTWVCDRCSQQTTEPAWRYILQFAIRDHTGEQYVTAFGEQGEEILGMPASTLKSLEGTEQQSQASRAAMFTPRLFTLKVAEESYNDEIRVKMTVIRQSSMNFAQDSQVILGQIREYLGGPHSNAGHAVNQANPVNPGYSMQNRNAQTGMGMYGGGFQSDMGQARQFL